MRVGLKTQARARNSKKPSLRDLTREKKTFDLLKENEMSKNNTIKI